MITDQWNAGTANTYAYVRARTRVYRKSGLRPAPKMELREAFVEEENEPFREAEVFKEVGDGDFNPSIDAFEHAANLITLQVSYIDTISK